MCGLLLLQVKRSHAQVFSVDFFPLVNFKPYLFISFLPVETKCHGDALGMWIRSRIRTAGAVSQSVLLDWKHSLVVETAPDLLPAPPPTNSRDLGHLGNLRAFFLLHNRVRCGDQMRSCICDMKDRAQPKARAHSELAISLFCNVGTHASNWAFQI